MPSLRRVHKYTEGGSRETLPQRSVQPIPETEGGFIAPPSKEGHELKPGKRGNVLVERDQEVATSTAQSVPSEREHCKRRTLELYQKVKN